MFDESTARVVILDRRCIDRQSISQTMLGMLNNTALCSRAGMHIDSLSTSSHVQNAGVSRVVVMR
jgi:hypothetical protein